MGRSSGNIFKETVPYVAASMPRSDETELLDHDLHDADELATNFRDIRRVNSLLGGTSTILKLLPRFIDRVPAGQTVSILDLGTGCGDIPNAISRWASKRDIPVRIVASDFSDDVLQLAREHTAGDLSISLDRYDARSVPLPDRSFDIVLCSMTLHHFPPNEAVMILREMDRLGRHGFILNDLRRSRLGYASAWIASRLTTRNRLTRNDAPLSVRRAYTPSELESLLSEAGVQDAQILIRPWFRMAAFKPGTPANA